MKFRSFERNTKGKDFIVGDIHGCFDHLDKLLTQVSFNTFKDRLFSVGDLADRGPDSKAALNFKGYAIQGNHENMTISYYNEMCTEAFYAKNGGEWFIKLDRETQKEYVDFFKQLPYAMEIETAMGKIGVVHAEAPRPWNDLKDTLSEDFDEEKDRYFFARLLEGRHKFKIMDEARVDDIHHVFVGHTIVRVPLTLGNVTYIDTGAFAGQFLTMVELGDKFTYHSIATSDEAGYKSSFI